MIPFPDRTHTDPPTAESPSDERFTDPVAMDPAGLVDSRSFPLEPVSGIDRPEKQANLPGAAGALTGEQDEGPAIDDELIEADVESPNPDLASGKRVALVGRFGSMNRREAANVLQSFQATVVDLPLKKIRNRCN